MKTKTTKSYRQAIRDKIASQPDEMVLFSEETVESLLDDLEAAEAEVQKLQVVLRQLMATGLAVEALLADEPSSVYIHPGIWAKLKEHRGYLQRALTLITQPPQAQESESGK